MYYWRKLTKTDLNYINARLLKAWIENIIKECCEKHFEENRRKIYDIMAWIKVWEILKLPTERIENFVYYYILSHTNLSEYEREIIKNIEEALLSSKQEEK